MSDIERLNEHLQKEFYKDKNYYTLERYVMSELLSPIEDCYNAIEIIRKNSSLCEGLNLYYVAAFLCAEWLPETVEFLEKLNNMLDSVEDKDKSIIYYLNAYYLSCTTDNWRTCEKYRFNLLKSVEFSKNIKFVNNWFALSKISEGKEAYVYLQKAIQNIQSVENQETLNAKPLNYWLLSQRFIDEFILGTCISQENYLKKFFFK